MIDINAALPLPSAAQMRQWDSEAIDFGIPETMLMESAARSIFLALMERESFHRDSYVIFMGNGNNGGDAAALGRHLTDAGRPVLLLHTTALDRLKGAAAWHARLAQKDHVPMRLIPNDADTSDWLRLAISALKNPVLIDGLLGTGFSGQLRPNIQKLVEAINTLALEQNCPIFSIDVPSGLDSDTGKPEPIAIRADTTFTLAAAKPGLVLPCARVWTGNLKLLSIGFPSALMASLPSSAALLDGRIISLHSEYPVNSYKNRFGHVLVLGGAGGLSGAAHLAAAASLRSGSGLVTCAAPSASETGIKCSWPEIMFFPLGANWPSSINEDLARLIRSCTACIVGPGMGRDKCSAIFLECFLRFEERPATVIDADALMILAKRKDLHCLVRKEDICTPHPGEAGELLNKSAQDVQNDRNGALEALSSLLPAAIVLKGASTLVGQKGHKRFLSPYDIPQLAIGGAGDVLAGIAGSMLAQGSEALAAALEAVVRHALAGLYLAKVFPERGILATQIAETLPHLKRLLHELPSRDSTQMPWPSSF